MLKGPNLGSTFSTNFSLAHSAFVNVSSSCKLQTVSCGKGNSDWKPEPNREVIGY